MKILYLLSIIFIYFTILNAQIIKEECIWWVDYSADSSIADGSFEKPYLYLQNAITNVVSTTNKCGDPKNSSITRVIYIRGGSNENVYTQSLITVSDVLFEFPILVQAVDKPEIYQFNNTILPFNPNNYAVFVGKQDTFTISFQSSLTHFTLRGIEFRDGGYSSDLDIQSTVIVTGRSTVSFDQCRFINNIGGNHGALFYNSLLSSTMTNCLFENNQASSINGFGGAIMFPSVLARVSVSNITFKNNSASNGGAIYCNHQGLLMNDLLFEGNNAIRGGGLYTFEIPKVYGIWSNFTFKNNNATYGGGLYDFGSSNLYSHILYEANKATDGGATYLNNSIISVIYSNFIENSALNDGGAIYAKDIKDSLKVNQLLIKDSNFTLNTATNGGALYCIDAIARFNVNDRYSSTNMASNSSSSSNIDYCLSTCVTTAEDCGCPGGCGVPKKDNNPNSNAKIAVAIFLPITLILLGIVGFLLWKTHSKSKSFRTKVAPYDEIRLSPASQDTDDQL